jgi:hypothetical protein
MEKRADLDFEALEDELVTTPERLQSGAIDPGWVQLQRLKVDTRKWAISHRLPKKYGDTGKIALTNASGDGDPVFVVKSILDKE